MAGLPGSNSAAAGVFAQPRGEAVIADPDAEIRLQRAEAEIEQHGLRDLPPAAPDDRGRSRSARRAGSWRNHALAGKARSSDSSRFW